MVKGLVYKPSIPNPGQYQSLSPPRMHGSNRSGNYSTKPYWESGSGTESTTENNPYQAETCVWGLFHFIEQKE